MDVAREAWEQKPVPHRSVIEHVKEMRERIDRVMPLVREHLTKAQELQQRHYNRAEWRSLSPTLPVRSWSAGWARKPSPHLPGPPAGMAEGRPAISHQPAEEMGGDKGPACHPHHCGCSGRGRRTTAVGSSESWAAAPGRSVLRCVLSDPGLTQVLHHKIRMPPGIVVWQWPYRVLEARRRAFEEEIQQMLKLGMIEPSNSPWSSPIFMVPKPDGTLHFCNDFCRLNEVSEFDGYPMPRGGWARGLPR